jgi:hypothetical protein
MSIGLRRIMSDMAATAILLLGVIIGMIGESVRQDSENQEAIYNSQILANCILMDLYRNMPLKVVSVKVFVDNQKIPQERTFWDLNFKEIKHAEKISKMVEKSILDERNSTGSVAQNSSTRSNPATSGRCYATGKAFRIREKGNGCEADKSVGRKTQSSNSKIDTKLPGRRSPAALVSSQ